ncbi:MAG: hypothetical protein ACFNT5_08380, partial [Cardiobacterium hominis]
MDIKKDRKDLYQPAAADFAEVDVPAMTYLAAHSAHPDGQPNPEYAQASKPRFAQWIIDMCTRERDQA